MWDISPEMGVGIGNWGENLGIMGIDLCFWAENGGKKASEKMKKFFTTKPPGPLAGTPRKELTTNFHELARRRKEHKSIRHKGTKIRINREFPRIGTKKRRVIRGTGDQEVDIRVSGKQETDGGFAEPCEPAGKRRVNILGQAG